LHRKPMMSREMAILKGVLKIFFSVSITLFLRFGRFSFQLNRLAFLSLFEKTFPYTITHFRTLILALRPSMIPKILSTVSFK
jgi:hypothetical protein